MNRKVIIVGASGHGKVVADIVLCSHDVVLGFLDDNTALPEAAGGFPILGRTEDYYSYPEAEFIIAIGNAAVRERIAASMDGVRWYSAVHPSAVISPLDTEIGTGTVVMANAVINPGAKIGRHCIVNTGAVVEHDSIVEDFAHISVGARLAGTVRVGERTWVGIGAVISNNVAVGPDCMVGAGAVVVKNIAKPGVYVGVPARKIR